MGLMPQMGKVDSTLEDDKNKAGFPAGVADGEGLLCTKVARQSLIWKVIYLLGKDLQVSDSCADSRFISRLCSLPLICVSVFMSIPLF